MIKPPPNRPKGMAELGVVRKPLWPIWSGRPPLFFLLCCLIFYIFCFRFHIFIIGDTFEISLVRTWHINRFRQIFKRKTGSRAYLCFCLLLGVFSHFLYPRELFATQWYQRDWFCNFAYLLLYCIVARDVVLIYTLFEIFWVMPQTEMSKCFLRIKSCEEDIQQLGEQHLHASWCIWLERNISTFDGIQRLPVTRWH